MNKPQLVTSVATSTSLPAAQVGLVLDALTDAITNALKAGEEVAIPGFGAFAVKVHASRPAKHPVTGEIIIASASRLAKFKTYKDLKAALNQR